MIETVETESWAQPGVHPNGMSRAAALAEERGRLRELGACYFSADARAYEVADAVERNRRSGLYQEDQRFSSPEHFVADGSGISLRSVQRHVKLARAFPRHVYLELRKEDLCLTTLERIAEAQPEARPALLAIARQVKDVVAVCAAYTAWLKQRQKLQAMEDPEAVMLEAALRSLRQRRAEHRQRNHDDGKDGKAGKAGKDGKDGKDGKADKDGKAAGEQRNLDRDPGPSQLAAEKLAKLAAERDHLRVEHELMTAERDRLAAERDQLRAEREQGSAQGTLDPAEREKWAAERAAADKMSADLADKLSAESAARATLQADHQRLQDALSRSEAALAESQARAATQDASA